MGAHNPRLAQARPHLWRHAVHGALGALPQQALQMHRKGVAAPRNGLDVAPGHQHLLQPGDQPCLTCHGTERLERQAAGGRGVVAVHDVAGSGGGGGVRVVSVCGVLPMWVVVVVVVGVWCVCVCGGGGGAWQVLHWDQAPPCSAAGCLGGYPPWR